MRLRYHRVSHAVQAVFATSYSHLLPSWLHVESLKMLRFPEAHIVEACPRVRPGTPFCELVSDVDYRVSVRDWLSPEVVISVSDALQSDAGKTSAKVGIAKRNLA